jgi:hypothetical protein
MMVESGHEALTEVELASLIMPWGGRPRLLGRIHLYSRYDLGDTIWFTCKEGGPTRGLI